MTGYSSTPRVASQKIDRDELVNSIDLRTIIELEDQRDHGSYLSGRCPHPEHQDDNPSFMVYPNWFECLSSGAHGPSGFKGTIIDWFKFAHQLSPSISFGVLLQMIQEQYCSGSASVYKPVKKDSIAPREVWTETLPKRQMNPKKFIPLTGEKLDFFCWRYQLTPDVIEHEQISYFNRLKSFAFPIWDCDHERVLIVRYRRDDNAFQDNDFTIGKWKVPRYFGAKGQNSILLYNRERLKRPRMDIVRIAFGEMTTLFIDRVLGLDAVSVTNGTKSFKAYYASLIKRVYDNVIIVPDGKELVEAVKAGMMFGPMAQVVNPLIDKGDVIDWVRDGHLTKETYHEWESNSLLPYNGLKSADNGVKLWT